MTHLEANALYDLYAPLLTDRQREILSLSIQEDLSYGEIAAELGISRAACLDAVKRAETLLESYEQKLGLKRKRDCILELVQDNPALYHQIEELL